MKKKILVFCILLVLVLGIRVRDDEEKGKGYVEPLEIESTEEEECKEEEESKEEVESKEDYVEPQTTEVHGMHMSVDSSMGTMSITRQAFTNTDEIGDEGVWTIFVYMCGTDLESINELGTDDIIEMQSVQTGDRVRFVLETGGAAIWNNNLMKEDRLQRFLIQNEGVMTVDEQPQAGMGRERTLSEFLEWGVENYASEHMGVVLWNHGGGSITGVCFDENDNCDSLDLMELNLALYKCCKNMNRKFDFIGFDACLMSTVEVANILASYGEYMYGSQEMEPGGGWDYQAIGEYLAEYPEANGAELGKVVSDSFLEASNREKGGNLTTLSVVDLSKIDALLVSFNEFARNMYAVGADTQVRAEIIRNIGKVDNFGGNNKSEGYTNMVDMGGIVKACAPYVDGAEEVLQTLDDAVIYSVSGEIHSEAMGLSIYYPLCIQGSYELTIFSSICISPYYLSFVDRLNQSGVTGVDSFEYNIGKWFDEDGVWNWNLEERFYEYWEYLNGYVQTGESLYITFEQEAHMNEDGMFCFELDDFGSNNVADVCAVVYEVIEDDTYLIELGETGDVLRTSDKKFFTDYFDGYWLSLPDGQTLATYIVESSDEFMVYTSPVLLNGELTHLRLYHSYEEGYAIIEGAWEGINEYGAAAREIVQLQSGDVICPCYYTFEIGGDEEFYYYGDEYTVTGDTNLNYSILRGGDYLYEFCIYDIYGDYYLTDSMMFYVDGLEVGYYIDWEGNW